MAMETEEILAFWLDEVGPRGWYEPDAALDARVRERFGATWEAARRGGRHDWIVAPRQNLALIILLDQFPRNMFREDARAFASDARALAAAKGAVGRGFDLTIEPPARQFFYLPMMHSEVVSEQARSVRLFAMRGEGDNLDHARAHRAVIRRFGRFPYRNAALGRASTAAEREWLEAGGYKLALAENAG